MTINIISAYQSQDKVICLAVGQSFIFPYKLTDGQAEKLTDAVNDARRIDTDKWSEL